MKKHPFLIFSYLLACIGLMLLSCEKSLEMSVSAKEVIFDAYPDEAQSIDIRANVAWTIKVIPADDWLAVEPVQGKGDATISFIADEYAAFTGGRSTFITISGEGTQTDTIKVTQRVGTDVAEEIEDEIFRQYCLDEFDRSPKDGKLSLKEVRGVSVLDVKGLGITSLAGVEYFSNLNDLNCSTNLLESIDISKNKNLLVLDCSYNESLADIDVSENVMLTDLTLWGVSLRNIDVRQNTALRLLVISNNPVGTLDVSANRELDYLNCNETELTQLDVGNNVKLRSLYCANNQLSTLDVSKNTSLGLLWCDNNSLVNINLFQNLELETLSCSGNRIETLDVSRNVMLISLYCDRNRLTTLDVRQNTKLREITCSSNNLTGSIDLSLNKLQRFNFKNNPLLNTIYIWPDFPIPPNGDYYQTDSPPPTYYQ